MLLYRHKSDSKKGSNWTLFTFTMMIWAALLFLWTSDSEGLKIDISNQSLEVVPRNLNNSVSTLILDHNVLITLNHNSFDTYVQLKRITLRHCQTIYIRNGTFDYQYNLRALCLDHCHIMQLPQIFGPSTNIITEFTIYGGYTSNSIFKFPYFSAFINLNKLVIGGRNYQSFNTNILPSTIKHFRVDFAELLTFPDFKNQSELDILTVRGNSISIIPQGHIDTLSELTLFRADRNKIRNFPNLSHMKKLRLLEIHKNDISLFPREHISELESLEKFIASNNLVKIMPNISYLPMLESADFSNNLIQHVPASCLYGLPTMQSLNLSGNIISQMDDNTVPPGNLYLHDNQLATVPDLYDSKLESLTLQGNPLVCDQLLCWLRMGPFERTLLSLDKFSCASPSTMNGSLVMNTHPTDLGCYKGKLRSRLWARSTVRAWKRVKELRRKLERKWEERRERAERKRDRGRGGERENGRL